MSTFCAVCNPLILFPMLCNYMLSQKSFTYTDTFTLYNLFIFRLHIATLSILHHRTHQLYRTPGYTQYDSASTQPTDIDPVHDKHTLQLSHNALPFASNSTFHSDVISLHSPTLSTALEHRPIEPMSSILLTWDSPWTQVELVSKTRRPDPVLHVAYFPHYSTLLLNPAITEAGNFATLLMIILALLQDH